MIRLRDIHQGRVGEGPLSSLPESTPPIQPVYTQSPVSVGGETGGVDRPLFEIPAFLFTFRRFVALPIEIIAENFPHCPPATQDSVPGHHPPPPCVSFRPTTASSSIHRPPPRRGSSTFRPSPSAPSKRGWLRPILRIRIRKPQSFEGGEEGERAQPSSLGIHSSSPHPPRCFFRSRCV